MEKKKLGCDRCYCLKALVAHPPPCPVAILSLYGFGFSSFTFQWCGHWHNNLLEWRRLCRIWLMIVATTLWLVCLVSIKDKTKDKKHVVAWVTSTAQLFIYFWMHNLEIFHMEKSISWWPTFKDILTLSSIFEKRKRKKKTNTWDNQE